VKDASHQLTPVEIFFSFQFSVFSWETLIGN